MHDSMSNLKELQPEVKTKLASQGIRTTTQLLEHTDTQKQCAELAHEVGTTLVAIKELANRADLMRLAGVGGDFSNMLEEAGVNSCKELQHRVPEKLFIALEAIHTDKKIGYRAPALAQRRVSRRSSPLDGLQLSSPGIRARTLCTAGRDLFLLLPSSRRLDHSPALQAGVSQAWVSLLMTVVGESLRKLCARAYQSRSPLASLRSSIPSVFHGIRPIMLFAVEPTQSESPSSASVPS